jgi:hypothetical protein
MRIMTTALSEFYHDEFMEAAAELGIELIIIDPEQVNIIFGQPSKIYDNQGNEIIADGFFVRAMNKSYTQCAYLAQALKSQGCIMLDGIERFNGTAPNKMITSMRRSVSGVGAKTIKFTNNFIRANQATIRPMLPLFAKPISSSQNRGLVRINTIEELITYNTDEYVIQENLNIVDEYRVLAHKTSNDITVFGITHKKTIGLRGSNPGKKFKISENTQNRLIEFIRSLPRDVNGDGLFGYDIAKLENGSLVLIEANRSPMWERTERIRKVSVASEILKLMLNLYNTKNAANRVR